MNDRQQWRTYRFDQIAANINERVDNPSEAGVDRYVGLEHLDPDSLKIRRWGSPSDVEATKLRFYPGDIIFGRRRAYQRKLGVADFEGICSAHAMVLRAKPDVVLPEFLPFFMQSDLFMERAQEISVGSLSPTINWKTLAAQEFALPPLDEQRKATQVLLALLKSEEAVLEFQRACLSLESSFLNETFGDYFNTDKPWPMSELRNIAYIQSGVAKGRNFEPGKTVKAPYIAVSNVQDGFLDLTEVKNIVVEIEKVERYLLQPGDVLMTEGGDPDKLGRGTVWEGEVQGCVHQNHIFAIRTDHTKLNPWFLAAVLRSSYGKGYFLACAKRTSNLATINKQQVGNFLVPDLTDQNKIVNQWMEIRATNNQSAKRIILLRQTKGRFLSEELKV
jgi:type I restriction enzyme S subunit